MMAMLILPVAAQTSTMSATTTATTTVTTSQLLTQIQQLINALRTQINILLAMRGQIGTGGGSGIFLRDLSVGSTGPDVVRLQDFLLEQGTGPAAIALRNTFAGGVSKGYFGPLTRAALIEYQLANNLPATGLFNLATRSYITTVISQVENNSD